MKRFLYVISALALFFAWSCEEAMPELTLTSDSEMSFGESGGQGVIYYSLTGVADGSMVTASANSSWVTDFNTATSGKVTFNVTPNTETSARSCVVKVSYGSEMSISVTITQAAKSSPVDPGPGEEPEPGEDPEGGVSITDGYLTGYYMLRSDGATYQYTLYFSEVEIDLENEDIPSREPNSPIIMVDFYSDVPPVDGARVPNGTWVSGEREEPGYIDLGDCALFYTDATGMPDVNTATPFTSATLKVEDNELTFVGEDADGNVYEAYYAGDYTLIDDGSDVPDGPDDPINPDEMVFDYEYTLADFQGVANGYHGLTSWGYNYFFQLYFSGDVIYAFDLYSPEAPASMDQILLPTGTYEIARTKPENGLINYWQSGFVEGSEDVVGFVSGKMEVTEDGFVFIGDDDLGRSHKIDFDGVFPFFDESSNEVNRTAQVVNASYEGELTDGTNSYHYYDITLSDHGLVNGNQMYTNSFYYRLGFFMSYGPETLVNGMLPYGIYEISSELRTNQVYASYSLVTETDDSSITYQEYLLTGYVEITPDGITLDCTDAQGRHHLVSYNGSWTIDNLPEAGDGWQMSNPYAYRQFYGDKYQTGSNIYTITIPPHLANGRGMMVEIATLAAMGESLQGNYAPVERAEDMRAGCYRVGYYEYDESANSTLAGSWLYEQDNAGQIISSSLHSLGGTVLTINETGDGSCAIKYDGVSAGSPDWNVEWYGYYYPQIYDITPEDYTLQPTFIEGNVAGVTEDGDVAYRVALRNVDIYDPNANSDRYTYSIILFSDVVVDNFACFDLPEGIYTIDGSQNDGTAQVSFEDYVELADGTFIQRSRRMVSGSINVGLNGIESISMIDELGGHHYMSYSGSTHFDDVASIMTEDIVVPNIINAQIYISDWGDMDTDRLIYNAHSAKYVSLRNNEYSISLVLLSPTASGPNELVSGMYDVRSILPGANQSITGNTVMAGLAQGSSLYYSAVMDYSKSPVQQGLLNYGTVNIERNGDTYTIRVEGYNDDLHNPKRISFTCQASAAAASATAPTRNEMRAMMAPTYNAIAQDDAAPAVLGTKRVVGNPKPIAPARQTINMISSPKPLELIGR